MLRPSEQEDLTSLDPSKSKKPLPSMKEAQQMKNQEDTVRKKLHARLSIAMEALALLQVETIASVCACQE